MCKRQKLINEIANRITYILLEYTYNKGDDRRDSEENRRADIETVFENTPKLAEIGSPDDYSRYLYTIFPRSAIRDIVYHGTNSTRFNRFDKKYSGTSSKNTYNTDDIFFIKYKAATSAFGKNIVMAVINVQNPNIIPLAQFNRNWFNTDLYRSQRTGDGIIGQEEKTPYEMYDKALDDYCKDPTCMFTRKPKGYSDYMEEQLSTTYVVYNPDQIHILGSEGDIKKFKHYMLRNRG